MALELDAGVVRRGHLYFLDPDAILMQPDDNVREVNTEEALEIASLARSIKTHGQLQPIRVRKLSSRKDKRVTMVSGWRRLMACRLLKKADPDFRVQCVIENMDAREGTVATIVENIDRLEMNPVDKAKGVRQLRAQGMKTQEIAQVFKCSTDVINALTRLNDLEPKVKDALAAGKLTIEAAMATIGMDEAEMAKVVGMAEESKKVGVKAVKAATGKRVTRGLSDLKKVLEGRDCPVAAALRAFLAGEGTDNDLTLALDVAAGYTLDSEVPAEA